MRKVLLAINLLFFICQITCAKEITGTVGCGKKKLANVIVTDGKNFVKTNKKGIFKINADDKADFIYIVTPGGYVAPYEDGAPQFYLPITAKDFHFELQHFSSSKDYTIVAIADPQMLDLHQHGKFTNRPLPELASTCKQLKEQGQTIGIALGDISWDSGKLIFPYYKKSIQSTEIPFYPVVGNHDYDRAEKGDSAAEHLYKEAFGPLNYAFGLGKDYVIVIDNIIYDTQKKYQEGYSEEVLQWVQNLLQFIPKSSHLYVASHCPLYRWWLKQDYAKNGKRLIEILKDYDVNALSGHAHINNNWILNNHMREHNIAALCGTWWITPHCNDGTPGGYKIFSMKKGKLSWYYKSLGQDKNFQMEVFSKGESEEYPESIIANVWDYDENWKVEWQEDGLNKGDMERVTTISPIFSKELTNYYKDKNIEIPGYKRPRKNTHYFKATPSANAHTISVIVKDCFGHKWKKDINL